MVSGIWMKPSLNPHSVNTEVNVFYVSIRKTENYDFYKIRTAGVTGNATNYKNSQSDNPMFSTVIFATSRH